MQMVNESSKHILKKSEAREAVYGIDVGVQIWKGNKNVSNVNKGQNHRLCLRS